jgi:hypothetical protein
VVRKFDTPRDLAALRERRDQLHRAWREGIFSDPELLPLKGQLTLPVPQPDVQRHQRRPDATAARILACTMAQRRDRTEGTQRDVWTLEPDEAERKRVVDGHIALFSDEIRRTSIVVAVGTSRAGFRYDAALRSGGDETFFVACCIKPARSRPTNTVKQTSCQACFFGGVNCTQPFADAHLEQPALKSIEAFIDTDTDAVHGYGFRRECSNRRAVVCSAVSRSFCGRVAADCDRLVCTIYMLK